MILDPGTIFSFKGMLSLYQVDTTGNTAILVLDHSGGAIRRSVDLTLEPDFEPLVITAMEIQGLRKNKEFTGTLPPEEAT